MHKENRDLFGKHVLDEVDGSRSPPIKLIWKNIISMSILHLLSIYTMTLIFCCNLYTVVFNLATGFLSALGVTAGAHRLWTHRSYKAKLPLRVFLIFLHSLALQSTIYEWCRDHRSHHKFSETDADPHNSKRGFFFCHVGWLLVQKHPEVARKGKTISLDDLMKDPVVCFQRRYFLPLAIICCFVLPTLVPWYLWGETLWNAYCMNILRYCATLNITWTVNSFAHLYGKRPYDKSICARENLFVAFAAIGEGFHNYHHTFPSDYSTSEFGWKFNPTTMFIDFMAMIGQATDRKTASAITIENRMKRSGSLAIKKVQ